MTFGRTLNKALVTLKTELNGDISLNNLTMITLPTVMLPTHKNVQTPTKKHKQKHKQKHKHKNQLIYQYTTTIGNLLDSHVRIIPIRQAGGGLMPLLQIL